MSNSLETLPGWTQNIVGALETNALYDSMFLDSAGIAIEDTNGTLLSATVIDGRFTALLQSGLGYSANGAFPTDTTLSQTGLIPLGTESLRFKARAGFNSSSAFVVTLGGQALSLTHLGSGTNNNLYGANVSQWAGQTAQLSFTVIAERPHVNDENLFLDDIQFSTQPIPVFSFTRLSAAISGSSIAISWSPLGGTLESSPLLGRGAVWTTVGTQNPTNLLVSPGARFFRIQP